MDEHNERGVLSTLSNMGVLCYKQRDYGKALGFFERALEGYGKVPWGAFRVADTLRNIALLHEERRQYLRAVDYFHRALNAYYAVGVNGHALPDTLAALGSLYMRLGRNSEALKIYGRALWAYGRLGDRDGFGDMLRGIGRIYSSQGRRDLAYTVALHADPARRVQPLGSRQTSMRTVSRAP
jgi:tetratricopeptide (TPR) repeat protein